MKLETRLFGIIEIDVTKIINFKNGIIGFEELKQFMIIHNVESEETNILWLQSLDNAEMALPIIDPLIVRTDYNPVVEDELFTNIGDVINDEILVFTTLTVPSDISKITTNLKAPLIINPVTMKGCQIIVDNDDYLVKYPIYDILKAGKEENKEGE